jgi:ketosteroid isomerase-like protein
MQSLNACDGETAALRSLLETEFAFGQRAQTSVRAAFLEYLAEDALVLAPAGPVSGRAFYSAAKEDPGSLEWYPAGAELADSGDLGFTTGPWTYSRGDARIHGHFLTIWKRDAGCRWTVEFDGGVSHAADANAEPRLTADSASYAKKNAPPPTLIVEDAVSRASKAFRDTAREDGFPAGLRTYARTVDFRFYTDGEIPMGVAAANRYLTAHAVAGDWKEDARGRSADSTLAYSVGELHDARERSSHAYVQIWQYDPRVASWGLRVLLLNPLAHVPGA